MPAARRRRMMAERAAEGEDAEAEDVPMVESIENLEDTRGRPVREHIMAVSPSGSMGSVDLNIQMFCWTNSYCAPN